MHGAPEVETECDEPVRVAFGRGKSRGDLVGQGGLRGEHKLQGVGEETQDAPLGRALA